MATDAQPISIPRQAGMYVRRAREAQKLTQARLAEAAGVSERLLSSLELGDATGIRLDKLLAVFDALGLKLLAQGDALALCKEQSFAAPHRARATKARPVPASSAKASESYPDCLNNDSYQDLLHEVAGDMGIDLPKKE